MVVATRGDDIANVGVAASVATDKSVSLASGVQAATAIGGAVKSVFVQRGVKQLKESEQNVARALQTSRDFQKGDITQEVFTEEALNNPALANYNDQLRGIGRSQSQGILDASSANLLFRNETSKILTANPLIAQDILKVARAQGFSMPAGARGAGRFTQTPEEKARNQFQEDITKFALENGINTAQAEKIFINQNRRQLERAEVENREFISGANDQTRLEKQDFTFTNDLNDTLLDINKEIAADGIEDPSRIIAKLQALKVRIGLTITNDISDIALQTKQINNWDGRIDSMIALAQAGTYVKFTRDTLDVQNARDEKAFSEADPKSFFIFNTFGADGYLKYQEQQFNLALNPTKVQQLKDIGAWNSIGDVYDGFQDYWERKENGEPPPDDKTKNRDIGFSLSQILDSNTDDQAKEKAFSYMGELFGSQVTFFEQFTDNPGAVAQLKKQGPNGVNTKQYANLFEINNTTSSEAITQILADDILNNRPLSVLYDPTQNRFTLQEGSVQRGARGGRAKVRTVTSTPDISKQSGFGRAVSSAKFDSIAQYNKTAQAADEFQDGDILQLGTDSATFVRLQYESILKNAQKRADEIEKVQEEEAAKNIERRAARKRGRPSS